MGLINSFTGSFLDITDENPKNVSRYNHQQIYSPKNKYIETMQGVIRGSGNLQNTFSKSNIDLENPEVLGGPINESYITKIGSEIKNIATTHPFTPKNTYLDYFRSRFGNAYDNRIIDNF